MPKGHLQTGYPTCQAISETCPLFCIQVPDAVRSCPNLCRIALLLVVLWGRFADVIFWEITARLVHPDVPSARGVTSLLASSDGNSQLQLASHRVKSVAATNLGKGLLTSPCPWALEAPGFPQTCSRHQLVTPATDHLIATPKGDLGCALPLEAQRCCQLPCICRCTFTVARSSNYVVTV